MPRQGAFERVALCNKLLKALVLYQSLNRKSCWLQTISSPSRHAPGAYFVTICDNQQPDVANIVFVPTNKWWLSCWSILLSFSLVKRCVVSVDVILCQRDRTSCSIDLPLKKTALTLIEQQCHPVGLVDLELWHTTNKYFVIWSKQHLQPLRHL